MDISQIKIGIIGGGNLGKAVAEGFLKAGIEASGMVVSRRRVHLLEDLRAKGVRIEKDNLQAVVDREVIILAVKPYQAEDLLTELRPALKPGQILVSLMTGFTMKELASLVPEGVLIFRVMPNTAVALQESMTLISAPECEAPTQQVVSELFETLGKVIFINEELMSAATVLGACGIAFALRFIRAAIQGGVEIGFGADVAQQIVAQTVKGATELILQTGRHPEQEIDKVTTPKGITISGLNEMEHQGFSSALIRGLLVSFNKLNNKNN
ncbi:MAG: pyrroline-5-carboxylate reductase [Marinilabiliales bacterium]|nr:pyrroline-5-carboxylate reductase [Marinilabiliales bacterium]